MHLRRSLLTLSTVRHTPAMQAADPAARAARLTPVELPPVLQLRILAALPVDSRARCSCVCRTWRDALADPALWAELDLNPAGLCVALRCNDHLVALLRGAAARARGTLHTLRVPYTPAMANLADLLGPSAGSLRELHVTSTMRDLDEFGALAASLPRLHTLDASGWFRPEEAARLRQTAPALPALRLRALTVDCDAVDGRTAGYRRLRATLALLADVVVLPTLAELTLRFVDARDDALAAALVDCALARRLASLSLHDCTPPPAAQLARLVAGGSLAKLGVWQTDAQGALLDESGAALVAAALRASTTLQRLELCEARLCRDMRAAELVLGALVGHASLQWLTLRSDDPGGERAANQAALGAALGAIVAADAPALTSLLMTGPTYGDQGPPWGEAVIRPVLEALPRNSHLRRLDISFCTASADFEHAVLLPAVQANASLRHLGYAADDFIPRGAHGVEAVRLVASRTPRAC